MWCVYVTDITNNCVSVFTSDGVYVTPLGQCGNKEGDFISLCILRPVHTSPTMRIMMRNKRCIRPH